MITAEYSGNANTLKFASEISRFALEKKFIRPVVQSFSDRQNRRSWTRTFPTSVFQFSQFHGSHVVIICNPIHLIRSAGCLNHFLNRKSSSFHRCGWLIRLLFRWREYLSRLTKSADTGIRHGWAKLPANLLHNWLNSFQSEDISKVNQDEFVERIDLSTCRRFHRHR